MSQVEGKPAAQEEKREKMQIRASVERIAGLIAGLMLVTVLFLVAATADSAHDKYSLTSPGGIAFSLLSGSPKIDAGNPKGCTDGNGHRLKPDSSGPFLRVAAEGQGETPVLL